MGQVESSPSTRDMVELSLVGQFKKMFFQLLVLFLIEEPRLEGSSGDCLVEPPASSFLTLSLVIISTRFLAEYFPPELVWSYKGGQGKWASLEQLISLEFALGGAPHPAVTGGLRNQSIWFGRRWWRLLQVRSSCPGCSSGPSWSSSHHTCVGRGCRQPPHPQGMCCCQVLGSRWTCFTLP